MPYDFFTRMLLFRPFRTIKYGCYYFDLDVIHLRPVTFYRNFIAAESSEAVAIGALHFDKNHPVINDVVKLFSVGHDPDK